MDRWQCAWVDVLDHCVQLVGYDATGPTPYYAIRNSCFFQFFYFFPSTYPTFCCAGTDQWGIDGYIHLEYGWDVCGVANDANYVTI